jgi:hypothetical protein
MTDKAAGKKQKMTAVKKGKSISAAVAKPQLPQAAPTTSSPLKTAHGPCTFEEVNTKDVYLIEQGEKMHILTAADTVKYPPMACVELQSVDGASIDIADWHSTPKAQIRLSS